MGHLQANAQDMYKSDYVQRHDNERQARNCEYMDPCIWDLYRLYLLDIQSSQRIQDDMLVVHPGNQLDTNMLLYQTPHDIHCLVRKVMGRRDLEI